MDNLIFVGVPLGPIVSGLVQIIKSSLGPKADQYAVWINAGLSLLAFLLVFFWQQGQIPKDTQQTITLALGVLTTFLASAGTYDVAKNAGRVVGVK